MKTQLLRLLALLALALPSVAVLAQPGEPGPDAVTHKSGLVYQDLEIGEGKEAKAGARVQVHYTGWLKDGTKFDSSVDRKTAFSFQLGRGQVIRGWELGVQGMKAGGKRKLWVPAKLGYGRRGKGPVPKNADLVFEVQLLAVM